MKIRKIIESLHPAAHSLLSFHLIILRPPGNRGQCYTEMNSKLPHRKMEATILLDVRLIQEYNGNQTSVGDSPLHLGLTGLY